MSQLPRLKDARGDDVSPNFAAQPGRPHHLTSLADRPRSKTADALAPSPTVSLPMWSPTPSAHAPSSNAAKNQQLGVATQLSSMERQMEFSKGVSAKHHEVQQRRMAAAREAMGSRLEEHLRREQQREVSAATAARSRSAQAIAQQWQVALVHQQFAAFWSSVRREQRAKNVVRQFITMRCLQVLRRRRTQRLRAAKVEALVADMPAKPTPSEMQQGQLFRKLPATFLLRLQNAMQPCGALAGETVAHADAPGTQVLFLVEGELRVWPAHGTVPEVAALPVSPASLPLTVQGRGPILYEPVLLCDEAYDCRVTAVTDVKLWTLNVKAFHAELIESDGLKAPATQAATQQGGTPTPAPVATASTTNLMPLIERLSDSRRSAIIERRYRMSEEFVRKASSVLQLWSSKGIQQLLAICHCRIHRKGDTVVAPGQFGRSVVFIVSGKLEVIDTADGTRKDLLRDGQCCGDVASLLRWKEPTLTVTAVTNCDLWVLPAEDLHHFACHENAYATVPIAMLHEFGHDGPTHHAAASGSAMNAAAKAHNRSRK